MKINELNIKQSSVELEAEISEIKDERTFEKFGKENRVATAILKDETGTIKLSLWNDQIELATHAKEQGKKLRVSNGYVNEWQGEPQLTAGKFGKLEVIEEEKE